MIFGLNKSVRWVIGRHHWSKEEASSILWLHNIDEAKMEPGKDNEHTRLPFGPAHEHMSDQKI